MPQSLNFWGRNSPEKQRLHSLRSPLEAPEHIQLSKRERQALAWCPRGSPDNGDCNNERHRWSRSKSCKKVFNLKAPVKEDIASTGPLLTWGSRTLHKASWGECWTLATELPSKAPVTNLTPNSVDSFNFHLSLLLPCFFLQQLSKVLAKPLLVVFHCTRLQQFAE